MPIPYRSEFQQQTDLLFAVTAPRQSDPILCRIDELLHRFHLEPSRIDMRIQLDIVVRLYYATDKWLQLADRGSNQVNNRRRDAVYALYKEVVARMSLINGVPVNLLPMWLCEVLGKHMTEHGAEIDLQGHAAKYLTAEERERLRLEFHGGLAYRLNGMGRMALVNTCLIQPEMQHPPIRATFGGYVLSESGTFYCGQHLNAAGPGSGQFHSSYFAGHPVLCAGEIKITRGVVEHINDNSGHYQPTRQQMRTAVELLGIMGVNLDRLVVERFGMAPTRGSHVLREHLNVEWPGGPRGDNPLSRHEVSQTLDQNAQALEAASAFRQFKAHIPGVHSWGSKHRCPACTAYKNYFHIFAEAAARAGGAGNVVAPKPAPPNAYAHV